MTQRPSPPVPGDPSALPVEQAESCRGFLVSADGTRIRLELSQREGTPWFLELPTEGLTSLLKAVAEAQQRALPRKAGKDMWRVVRQPVSWSLERDLSDEMLTLVLVTEDGFQWCFSLADAEVFRMADCLREERMVTLPPAPGRQ